MCRSARRSSRGGAARLLGCLRNGGMGNVRYRNGMELVIFIIKPIELKIQDYEQNPMHELGNADNPQIYCMYNFEFTKYGNYLTQTCESE